MGEGVAGVVRTVNGYVADTHALYWYLTDSPRLGQNASGAFDEADAGQATIYVPAVAVAELFYMNEKLGRQLDFRSTLHYLQSSSQFALLPFLPEDTLDFEADRAAPEMHDRMIVGVARRMSLPLLTCDAAIVASKLVAIVW
jgi:PIN domain nuclease of toxin-antitoxin system